MSKLYTPWKIAHHRELLEHIKQDKPIAPLHVQLVPTNTCPHSCDFCAYRMSGYPSNETFNAKASLSSGELDSIIADCSFMGVKSIELTGGGEPTIHRDFPRLCEVIKRLGMSLGIVSNGTQQSCAVLDGLSHADWVRISIDAGTKETYSSIRRVPQSFHERARVTIRKLTSLEFKPVIGVSFVITKDNWKEILLACQNAKADGADNIRLGAVFQNEGAKYFSSFQSNAEELCRAAEKTLNDDTFKVVNLFNTRTLEQQQPDFPSCKYQLLKTYIGADGNVYRCCTLANNNRGLLGSIKDEGFMSLWFSRETQEKLRNLDARKCPACAYNDTNRFINYLTEKKPDHVNFI